MQNKGFYFITYLLLSLGTIVSPNISIAQQYYQSMEYGISLGAAHYFGDLNPEYGLEEVSPAASLLVRKNFNPYISVSTALTYTKLEYKDAHSNNTYQQLRNLSFSSHIVELAAMGEFNFFWFETGNREHSFTPFIALGVSAFYYNPIANLNGKDYELRKLGTEGQNLPQYADRKYSAISMAIPVGVGIKWWIQPGMNMSFQIVNRFTFTDYIDDVSSTYVGDALSPNPANPTIASMLADRSPIIDGRKMGIAGYKRGDENTRDQFLMAQISFTFQFKTYRCPNLNNTMWQGSSVNYK